MYTIDTKSLIRMWDLISGDCVRSYPLEIVGESNSKEIGDLSVYFKNENVIQSVNIDADFKYLIVGFEGGLV